MLALASLNRWTAAALHLAISALIAAIAVTIMLLLWYPQPYFDAMGGMGLLKLLVGVDVTIGPLLTLIIFDTRKKSLRFDLSVIAILQIAALIYGVYIMFEARPVYTAFVKDRFEVVPADQLAAADLAEGPAEYRKLSLTGPRMIGVRFPDPSNADEWNKLVFSGVVGKDIQNYPKYYIPYADAKTQVLAKAQPLTALLKDHPEREAVVRNAVEKSGLGQDALGYVPLMGREAVMTALVARTDAHIVGVLPIDPY